MCEWFCEPSTDLIPAFYSFSIDAGISRDNWHKRRKTGGKRKPYHKKRKYELGRPPANTKVSVDKWFRLTWCSVGDENSTLGRSFFESFWFKVLGLTNVRIVIVTLTRFNAR